MARKDGKMEREQIEVKKRPLEEQMADLQVRVACLEVSRLEETVKAQAGWINELEKRIAKLEKISRKGVVWRMNKT